MTFEADTKTRVIGQHTSMLIKLSMCISTDDRLIEIEIEDTLERYGSCISVHFVDRDHYFASAYHGPNWFCFNYDLLHLSGCLGRLYFRGILNASRACAAGKKH
jgi:hypothetical protein